MASAFNTGICQKVRTKNLVILTKLAQLGDTGLTDQFPVT
jgi:hypothetical protein